MASKEKLQPFAKPEDVNVALLIKTLDSRDRWDIWQAVTGHLYLKDKEKIWIGEYVEHGSSIRASQRIGYKSDIYNRMMRRPNIAMAVDLARKELEKHSKMNADYVRDYLHSVLELCPTDHFTPAPDGGWLIDVENWRNMPHEVKRLIENVELRQIRGSTYFAVTFVSKTAVLKMAAQFTLTQKHEHSFQSCPWEDITDATASAADHDVEAALDELRSLPSPEQNGHHVNGAA